ncbi:sorbitol dehydrogenase [Trichodelitschia bisporula]|uniref:Sorbitol dehydrogenase n=1 Tax=Trichodelitschia bisporula TaxID=703511 RepID=A0A6G1IAE4_9PEZI|nr:sorbitol dehydrogenase [Trichodelitschia bisporula]
MTETKASVLHGPKDLRIESRLLEPLRENDLQIAIHTTTICGSDVHYYTSFSNGSILATSPLTLGHESSGIVTAIGSEVTTFSPGDRVALEVGQPCSICPRCLEGRYNICPELKFRSSAKLVPHTQGTLQLLLNHPAKWTFKLPREVPLSLGALVEPMAVAEHAVQRAGLEPGARVLVFGAGPVGCLVAAVARGNGARVTVADGNGGRVRFAVNGRWAGVTSWLGDGHVVPPVRGKIGVTEGLMRAQAVASRLTENQQYDQYDAVFECTGAMECLQTAIYVTRPGGKVMLIGMGTPVQTLPISHAALHEIDLIGVFRYANAYPAAIERLRKAKTELPDFSTLLTHTFKGLENVEKAFLMASRPEDDEKKLVMKVAVQFGDDE